MVCKLRLQVLILSSLVCCLHSLCSAAFAAKAKPRRGTSFETRHNTQAGFRPARGCRDNVCALRWFIGMVLREGRKAVVTLIDYSAAFDTESQLFLDSALAEAGGQYESEAHRPGHLLRSNRRCADQAAGW